MNCCNKNNKRVKETEIEKLAKIIEATGGKGKVSKENQEIIHLFAIGKIDYETAVKRIKDSFKK